MAQNLGDTSESANHDIRAKHGHAYIVNAKLLSDFPNGPQGIHKMIHDISGAV
ncbi:MAG: hypothetical protein ACJARR_000519 [Pseudophaeobacter arcticus]|jgi:hypothetical protein